MRTDLEIIAHYNSIEKLDFFGTQASELLTRLEWDAVKPFLKPDAVQGDWKATPRDRESILAEMKGYIDFAIGKARDHRGLSASRSVDHFRAWIWLLGDEDFAAIDFENHAQYGAPVLKQICERFGFEWPQDEPLNNMARGAPCQAGCQSGCGRL